METLSTVKNHYSSDTVTGISVRQFITKCNNELTTANRENNCIDVTVYESSMPVDTVRSCTLELLGCPQHPLRTYVIWIEKNGKYVLLNWPLPQCRHPKGEEADPKKTFWVHHLLRALQKRKEEGLGKKPRSFEALCMFTWNRYNVIKLFYYMTYVTSFNLCDYLKWIWYYCESWIYINQVIPDISL